MPELVIVRHAAAHARNDALWPDDRQRPLTSAGKRKFRSAARAIGALVSVPDALLTSPLERARQTARILRREAGFPKPEVLKELRPAVRTAALITALDGYRSKNLAIVGHEPALSALLSELLAGGGVLKSRFNKGGVAVLRFTGRIRAGGGELLAFIPPRAFRMR